MKSFTLRQIAMFSKWTFYGLLVQLIFTGILIAGEGQAQSVKSVRKFFIKIEFKDNSLIEAFNKIEEKTGYHFAYEKNELSNSIKLNKKYYGKVAVSDVLLDISEEADIKFRQINKSIVVSKRKNDNSNEQSLEVIIENITITGKVTSSEDGSGVPGVNVIVKGTSQGTVTDVDGSYKVDVSSVDVVLVFSSVGFVTEEIQVGNRTVIDIVLSLDITQLGEVVVTAFGIEKEKKQLTYSAQNVSTDELTEARETNVINSLAGKVAGLDLTQASGGVGTASRVLLRGNRSITGNNQPLYIVDGVPISGSTNGGQVNEAGSSWQPIDGISNINPDDIASVTVLKGANATALYGSRAQNGAIVITTKKGKTKGLGIEFSTNFSMETPMIPTNFQNEYGQGSAGTYLKNGEQMWGPKMTGQMVDHWSPDPNWAGPSQYKFEAHPNLVNDFFSTGTNWANTIAVSTGNEKSQAYMSYTNTQSQGIVPNNKLRRNNFNVRLTSNLSEKLTVDAKLSYINQEIDNSVMTGDFMWNPVRAIYRQPRNISLDASRNYEYLDNEGNVLQHYWNPGSVGGENIFWLQNKTSRIDRRNRVIALASIRYEFIDGLSLMIRSSADGINDAYNAKVHNDSYVIGPDGSYRVGYENRMEMNNDFILNYNNLWNDTWSLDVSIGGNMRYNSWDGLYSEIGTRYGPFITPNLFSLSNASTKHTQDWAQVTKMNSLYAFATVGFKNYLFLDLTVRNDWSSTLPPESWSYMYPSAGLTWVISDMMNTLPGWLSFAKVRASYAIVGNDTNWAQLDQIYGVQAGGDAGYAYRGGSKPPTDLKPEKTNSMEIGADIRFFDNRLGIDFTWYKTNTYEQLIKVPLPVTSGWSNTLINAGNIENKGFEITLNATPVIAGDFKWDLSFNYAHNESLIVELTDEISEYKLTGGWMNDFKLVEGHPYGDIYTQGFQRDDAGNVLIQEANGLPLLTPGKILPMGNFNPDWFGGFSNQFSYKNINLGILFDMRMGGTLVSYTQALLTGDGLTKRTLEGRDGMIVEGVIPTYDVDGNIVSTRPNDVETTSEAYWSVLGGHNSTTGEPFVYDASYVRLREIVLGYTFNFQSTTIKGLRLSLYGRNLGFLYNASEVLDPLMNIGTGNTTGGVESFALPSTKQYGVNLKITF